METSQEVSLINDHIQGTPATDDAVRGKKRTHDTAESYPSKASKTPRTPIATARDVEDGSGRLSDGPAVTVPHSWDRVSSANDALASPQYSTQTYAQLAAEVLLSHPEGLQVHAIISSVKQRLPGYIGQERKLRSGISGALSTKSQGDNPTFVKTALSGPTKHPGAIWSLAKRVAVNTTAAPHARSSSNETPNGSTTFTEPRESDSNVTVAPSAKGPARTSGGESRNSDPHATGEDAPVRAWNSWNRDPPAEGLAAVNLVRTEPEHISLLDTGSSSRGSGRMVVDDAVIPESQTGNEQHSRDLEDNALMCRSPQQAMVDISGNRQTPCNVQPSLPDAVPEASTRTSEQQIRSEEQHNLQFPASGETANLSTSPSSSVGATEDNNLGLILGGAVSERRTDTSFSMVALADLYAWIDCLKVMLDGAKELLVIQGLGERDDHAAAPLNWATLLEAAKHDAGLDGPRLSSEAEISDVHQSLETLSRGKVVMTRVDLSISTICTIQTHMMKGIEKLQAVMEGLHRNKDAMEKDRQQTVVALQSVQQDLVKYITDP